VQVASQVFVWLLGALTALTGAVLAYMVVRRRRAMRPARARARRLIDDYARPAPPMPAAGADAGDADEELAKICPACGSRYGHQFRTCARDDNELATLN
jgi:hypothetical protein